MKTEIDDDTDLDRTIESYYELVDSFNEDIVNIHFNLNEDIDDLNELRIIQNKLEVLTTTFYEFNGNWKQYLNNILKRCNELKKMAKIIRISSISLIMLPYVGGLFSLLIILRITLYLRAGEILLQDIEETIKDLTNSCNIIERNINSNYILLNNTLSNYANRGNDRIKSEDDYLYCYANEIITNYIDGFDLKLEGLDINVQIAMLNILQQHLKTSSNDLEELLLMAKENSTQSAIVRKKKLEEKRC